ncbi:MAG: DMT family transporter [Pseudomonadota bacterium]
MGREVYISVGYLSFLVVVWGGNYTWVKIAVRDIGPLWFNGLRFGLAALVFAFIALALRRGAILLPARGERLRLAVIGLLQAGLLTALTALAMRWIEASRVVLIAYSVPIWALFWGMLILGERPTAMGLLGAGLGIAGLVILTDPSGMSWHANTLPGMLAAFVGVLGWGLGAVLYKRWTWQSPFWSQVFWQMFATASAMLLLAPLLEPIGEVTWSAEMLTVALYNAFVPLLLGFFCWMQALSRISAHAAGQILILAPIYGVFQSHLVLGEPLSKGLLLACALVIAGAVLTLRGQAARREVTR